VHVQFDAHRTLLCVRWMVNCGLGWIGEPTNFSDARRRRRLERNLALQHLAADEKAQDRSENVRELVDGVLGMRDAGRFGYCSASTQHHQPELARAQRT